MLLNRYAHPFRRHPAVDVIHRFDYDASGRLLTRRFEGINGTTKTLGYEYWPDSSLKRKRLTSISNASDGIDWSTFTYNGRSQVKKITYGNNVSTWFNYNGQNGFLNSQETRDGVAVSSPLLMGLD